MNRHHQAGSSRQPKLTYVTPDDPLWRRSFINCVEAVSGQKKLNNLYHQYRLIGETTGNIWADAISHLRLTIEGLTETRSTIPAKGPVVIVSNHPYGVLDGLSLCYAVSLIRRDFKFLAHSTFQKVPELEPYVLPVDFDGASAALRSNIETKKAALKHVRDGGAVVIFPAGRVSTADLVEQGYLKILSSDYMPLALLRAAVKLGCQLNDMAGGIATVTAQSRHRHRV